MVLKQMLKEMVRDFLTGLVLMSLVLLTVFAYTGVWPSFVVVSSGSMQHGFDSNLGIIDTGDTVLVKQGLPITYLEGRASGYSTYGDYGDVMIFQRPDLPFYSLETSIDNIIHRAIMYVRANGTNYDVSSLVLLPKTDWVAFDSTGNEVNRTLDVTSVKIQGMGYKHDLTITFPLKFIAAGKSGYVTMGDNNGGQYDNWVVPTSYVVGKARGEIPYLGLVKLLMQPSGTCCQGWDDQDVSGGTWTALDFSLIGIAAAVMGVWFLSDLLRRRKPDED